MAIPKLTFVIGGAASGKSAYAEELVIRSEKSKVYLATAQAFDDEMRAKIRLHIDRRGPDWTKIETPLEAGATLSTLTGDQICLLDCATMWLSNQMLSENDLAARQSDLLEAISTCAADLVVVSNEVGQGVVPDTPLGRKFREAQGRLNIELAARADLVVQVVVGLPNVLKGSGF